MPDSVAYLSIKPTQLTKNAIDKKKRKCQISELLLIQEYYWFTI